MLNLKELAHHLRLGQKDLAEVLGVKQSQVSMMMNGRRDVRPAHIKKLKERYGDIVSQFMMGDPTPQNVVYTGNVSGSGNNIVAGNGNNIGTADDVEIKETIVVQAELVNREGFDLKQSYEDGTISTEAQIKPTQDTVPLHDMKVYTETDEMEPEIGPNDPIFIALMQSPKDVIAGRMYFVDLYQGGIVRWVFPQHDGRLLLRAANSATPDIVVKQEEVRSISKVVAILKRPKSMPVEHLSIQATLEHRDHQINEMLSQQGRLIGIIERKIND